MLFACFLQGVAFTVASSVITGKQFGEFMKLYSGKFKMLEYYESKCELSIQMQYFSIVYL